ncbi:MAG: hypothetical protein ACYDAP_03575 [Thermoplasmataceae archaeon]
MKRFVVFTFLAVIMAMAAVPIGSAAGQFMAGNGTASVLSGPIHPDYGLGLLNGTAKALPIATSGNVTTIENDYTYAYQTKNATGVIINETGTSEYPSDMLFSNASMLQMTEHAVNKIDLNISAAENVSITLGYGKLLKNTTYSFNPLMVNKSIQTKNTNATYRNVVFSVSASDFLGNSSDILMYEVQFMNATANPSYSVSVNAIGVSSSQPWYTSSVDVSYVFAGVLLLVFGVLALPFHDLSISRMSSSIQTQTRKKSAPKPSGRPISKAPAKKSNKNNGGRR